MDLGKADSDMQSTEEIECMNLIIDQIEYYLPERLITNDYLSEHSGIDADFLQNKIGIHQRHIAGENESISDMALAASNKLFEKTDITRKDIDFLIVCTQNPDYKLPTTACIIQDRLDLPNSCFAFDINLGCSGFVYSMIIADSFIKSGIIKNALLIMVDQYSKIIDYNDKNTASLFGDAASAILLKQDENKRGIIDSTWGTDGSGFDKLILHNSGIVSDPEKSPTLYMNGREIFKFSMKVVPQSVNQILNRNNLKISDIDYFVLHQANNYMLREIQKRLEIDDSQMIIDMTNYGNTVSSTIPITLKNLIDAKKIAPGQLLILSGFGVGLSWGTILYKT